MPGARMAVVPQLEFVQSGALAAGIGGRQRNTIPACGDCM